MSLRFWFRYGNSGSPEKYVAEMKETLKARQSKNIHLLNIDDITPYKEFRQNWCGCFFCRGLDGQIVTYYTPRTIDPKFFQIEREELEPLYFAWMEYHLRVLRYAVEEIPEGKFSYEKIPTIIEVIDCQNVSRKNTSFSALGKLLHLLRFHQEEFARQIH